MKLLDEDWWLLGIVAASMGGATLVPGAESALPRAVAAATVAYAGLTWRLVRAEAIRRSRDDKQAANARELLLRSALHELERNYGRQERKVNQAHLELDEEATLAAVRPPLVP